MQSPVHHTDQQEESSQYISFTAADNGSSDSLSIAAVPETERVLGPLR